VAALAGLVVLARVGAHAAYFPDVFIAFLLLGIGAGLAFMPLLTVAMADVPPADAGLASGVINVSVQISAALGIAVLATLATAHTRTLAAHGQGHTAALLGGYHLAFVVAAACVAVGAVVAFLVFREPDPARVVGPVGEAGAA
jgi:MFS family permease